MKEQNPDHAAPPTTLSLDEIRRRLSVMNISAVADEAKIPAVTLYRLLKGKSDPLTSTVEAVSAYLRKHAGDGND